MYHTAETAGSESSLAKTPLLVPCVNCTRPVILLDRSVHKVKYSYPIIICRGNLAVSFSLSCICLWQEKVLSILLSRSISRQRTLGGANTIALFVRSESCNEYPLSRDASLLMPCRPFSLYKRISMMYSHWLES